MIRPVDRLFYYAHRGASAEAPENTLAAFRRALEVGADGIELDVHLAADGVPVVIHDATVERTTDAVGLVADWRADELATVDAGRWFAPAFAGEGVPTLAEVLKLVAGRLRVNVEIKAAAVVPALLALLPRFPETEVILSCFDRAVTAQLRRADPHLPLAVLAEGPSWHRLIPEAVALRASALHLHAGMVTRPLMGAARAAGLPVYVWTVDDAGEARTLIRAGVSGLFSNDPGRLRGQVGALSIA
jgi:glycerophosphoryl diester phosphodiesterase